LTAVSTLAMMAAASSMVSSKLSPLVFTMALIST
jgi:hypothetical protein